MKAADRQNNEPVSEQAAGSGRLFLVQGLTEDYTVREDRRRGETGQRRRKES